MVDVVARSSMTLWTATMQGAGAVNRRPLDRCSCRRALLPPPAQPCSLPNLSARP